MGEWRTSNHEALMNRFITYKWEGASWCVGKILRRITDSRREVNKQTIDFYDYYRVDEQEAAHALSLDNYIERGLEKPLISSGCSREGIRVSVKEMASLS